jgi:uncharacterized protein
MKLLNAIAYILVVVGGLNWGLVGFFDYNLVAHLLGAMPMVEKVVYCAVGVSALLMLISVKKCCSK